jgi:hypothetical protein
LLSWGLVATMVGAQGTDLTLLGLCAGSAMGAAQGTNADVRFCQRADGTTCGGQVVCTRLVRVLNIELALST